MKSQKFRKNRKTIKRATLIGQHTIKGGRKKKYLKNNNRQNQIRRNTRKMRGGTRELLMDNIRSGNIEEVTRILGTGEVELNNEDMRWRKTPLNFAVGLRKYYIVRLLLEHGANPNFTGNINSVRSGVRRGTALGNAITTAHVPIARLLINNGANIEGVCFNDGRNDFTPLDYAVNIVNKEMVRLILENGADPTNAVGYNEPMNRAQTNVMDILNDYRDAQRDGRDPPHLMEPRLSDIETQIQREMRQVEREMRQVERERPRENQNIIDLEEIITEANLMSLRGGTMNERIEFLKRKTRNDNNPAIKINIARVNVFNNSFDNLNDALKGNNKYARMSVKFIGEAGADAGGLTKEYFNLVSKDIVDPNKRLFKTYNNGGSYQPDTLGNKLDNFEEQYKFIGRLVGKAICSGYTLDELVFNKPFLKHIIDEEIVLEDVRFADCALYNSLMSVSAKPVDVWGLDFTNPVSSPRRGDSDYSLPLYQDLNDLARIPSTGAGEHKLVNDENKNDFINMKLIFITTYRIKQHIDAFLKGLYSMIPKKFLKLFTIEELELLISGFQTIEVNKIKEKTTYQGVYGNNKAQYERDNTIVWFWEILHEEDQEFLKKLLHFFTSSSRIGINSQFNITKNDEKPRYPVAHTCFNQLVLSNYDNKEQLKEMLTLSINQELTFGLI